MVAYACNPGTQKAEAGPPWDVWRFQESVDPSHSLVQDIQIIFKTVCSTSTNRATGSQVSGQFESCKISPISNYLFLPRSGNSSILYMFILYVHIHMVPWDTGDFSVLLSPYRLWGWTLDTMDSPACYTQNVGTFWWLISEWWLHLFCNP